MAELRRFRGDDLRGLAKAWNDCFCSAPNFVAVGEEDLKRRVLDQPGFDQRGVLVAGERGRVAGFVHFGPRLDWDGNSRWGPRSHDEGHIYALVAPETDRSLIAELLGVAEQRLDAEGARRILLAPSWVYGVQPFYNGIAGGYEMPGLNATRAGVIELAQASGFSIAAEYGTPEIDLSGPEPLKRLAQVAAELRAQASAWGLQLQARVIEERYFPTRTLIELGRGSEVVATAAYGLWPEYLRHYRRRLYGLTSVRVAAQWRGKGLGKLIMVEAMEAARRDGAEGVHLHVWRGNEVAWTLYHRALGFTAGHTWVTLEKRV